MFYFRKWDEFKAAKAKFDEFKKLERAEWEKKKKAQEEERRKIL